MPMSSFPTLCILCLVIVSSRAMIVDLSHKHGPDTFMAPGNAPYKRNITFKGNYLPGVFIELAEYSSGEHGGTHMDAPSHFVNGSTSVDNVPIQNLILDGVMIDCSKDVNGNASYVLPLQKLKDWELQHGKIPEGAGIVINYDWSSRFNNATEYVQSNDITDFPSFMYPTISPEAATWMIEERKAKLVAVDVVGPDLEDFPIHRIILRAGATIVENVRDPGRLPAKGFRLHAVPVAFVGAGGTQVRFYAITYDDDYFRVNSGHAVFSMVSVMVTTTSCFFLISFVRRMLFD